MTILQQIPITSPEGVILGTEKKYCRHDLRVVPRLHPLTVSENGIYPVPAGFAGHGKVTVNVTPKEEISLHITRNGTYRAPAGKTIAAITVAVPTVTEEETPDTADYTVALGKSFSLAYAGSSPTVECPACLTYYDDGGLLVFTGAQVGKGTVRLYESDTVLGEYTVTVTAAGEGEGEGGESAPACTHPYSATTSVTTAEPTCTDEGSAKCTCALCGKSWTEPLATLPHTYSDIVTEPTCTKGGYTTHLCQNCGDTYIDSETDPNGHNFAGGWVTKTEATCTAAGTETRTCLTCGATVSRATAALGHDWEIYEDPAASSGYSRTCTRCGVTETDITP